MSDLNLIILNGHICQDIEVRVTSSGRKVANFSVATNFMEKSQYHRVACWGKNADFAEKYLGKGGHVNVIGRMEYRDWVDETGLKRTSAEISVDRISGLGPRDRSSAGNVEPTRDYDANGNTADKDLPF